MTQIVKNLPAMRETWVGSLGWEESLEEGIATHSSILSWRIPMDRGVWWTAVHGVTKNQTQLSDFHFQIGHKDFPIAQILKNLTAMQETWVQFLGWEDHLKKGIATH